MSRRDTKHGAVRCYTLKEIAAFEKEWFKHNPKVHVPKAEPPRPTVKYKQVKDSRGKFKKKRVTR